MKTNMTSEFEVSDRNGPYLCINANLRCSRSNPFRRIRGRNRTTSKQTAFAILILASFCILCHFVMQLADVNLDTITGDVVDGSDGSKVEQKWNSQFLPYKGMVSPTTGTVVEEEGEEEEGFNERMNELRDHGNVMDNSGSGWTSITDILNEQELEGTRRRLPQCLIIGVRKCGTRALLEFLNIHPSVVKARDEVHFFDEDSKYSLGLKWYRDQMPPSEVDQVTIEKSPAYFVTESAPSRVLAMNSSIKLIVIVRDPVIRLISDYAQLAANKRARRIVGDLRPLKTFEESVLLPDDQVDVSYKPVQTSIYGLHFSRWIQMFPSNQIHVVDGDKLIQDPYPEVKKVESFLNLSSKIERENFSFNSTKGFYCVKLNGSDSEKCLNETKGRRHPVVDPNVISKLRTFYNPFNERFFQMVGKSFDWPDK